MVELLGTDPEHVQDHLGVLRVVLVPTVVQRLPRPGETDRRDQLRLEARHCQGIGERPVVITGGLERDPDTAVICT